jgi:hypothetical protein
MGPIIRNLKSVSGAILVFTVMLIATLWIWNFLSTHGVPGASLVASRLPGTGITAAPVVAPVVAPGYHGL